MDDLNSLYRSTSSLHLVNNDTGRVAYCGPYVLSAITGYPVTKVEAAINAYRHAEQLVDLFAWVKAKVATLGNFFLKPSLKH